MLNKSKLYIKVILSLAGFALSACVASASVEQLFAASKIVPDLLCEAPKSFLSVFYPNSGATVCGGNELTPTQVKDIPTVLWTANPNRYYTLILADPDAPKGAFQHWLVGNIPGNNVCSGESITDYIGSGPPAGSGLHRYVFLVYEQTDRLTFNEPWTPNTSANRGEFSPDNFAKKYNLGSPIAGNFYFAQFDEYVPILHKQLGV